MKTYELVTGQLGSVIRATEGEKETWIPLDPPNSDYAEYLAYLAWVEAGNNPDDFWNQDEGLI